MQVFIDDPGVNIAGGDLTPSGPPDLDVPVDFLESLTINTQGGDDAVAVDYSNGVFAPKYLGGHLPLNFNFGSQTAGDRLVLTGGSTASPAFASELYAPGTRTPGSGPFNAGEGTVELTTAVGGLVHAIDFTGLERPISDSVPLSDRLTVNSPSGVNTITLATGRPLATAWRACRSTPMSPSTLPTRPMWPSMRAMRQTR